MAERAIDVAYRLLPADVKMQAALHAYKTGKADADRAAELSGLPWGVMCDRLFVEGLMPVREYIALRDA